MPSQVESVDGRPDFKYIDGHAQVLADCRTDQHQRHSVFEARTGGMVLSSSVSVIVAPGMGV